MSMRYLLPILTFFSLFTLSQPRAMFAAAPTPTPVATLQIQSDPPQAEPGQPITVTLSGLPETVIKGQEMACISLQTADGFEVAGTSVISNVGNLETSPHMQAGQYQLAVTICGSGENSPSTRVGSTIFAQPYTITASTGQFDEIKRVISPDNQWTAIVNQTQGNLDLVSSTGQTQTILAAGSTVDNVTWSPNSNELLVVRTNRIYLQPLGSGVTSSGPLELWGISFKNNQPDQPRRLFSSPTFDENGAEQLVFGDWSPDGQHILFWVGILSASIMSDGLPPYMLDLTNQTASQIAEVSLLMNYYHSWSPDGSQLAITVGAGRETWQNKWLMLYDTRTATATTLISQTEQIPGAVAWSPNGEMLAYTAISATDAQKATDNNGFDNPGINQRRIYLLDMATKEHCRLNDVDKFQDIPSWNIDGTLYYVQQLTSTHFALMSLDNMKKTQEIKTDNQESVRPTYYGLGDWSYLLSFRPIDPRLNILTNTNPTNLELIRFIFTQYPPAWSDLWQQLTNAQYTDFTRQEADVTGDGQADIIFAGKISMYDDLVYMAILTHPKGQTAWQIAFYTDDISHYDSDVAVKIEAQRVKVDFFTSWGGTGTLSVFWKQHWIDCTMTKGCQEIWQVPLLQAWYADEPTINDNFEVSQVMQPQANIIQVTTQRFGIKDMPPLYYNNTSVKTGIKLDGTRLISGASSIDTYQQGADGKFTLSSQEQISPRLEISHQSDLDLEAETAIVRFYTQLAKSSNMVTNQGDEEARWGKPNRPPDKAINNSSPQHAATWVATLMSALDAPLCRLTAYQLENKKLKFSQQIEMPCISNFSQLNQADVDADGQTELLFLTFTPTPYSLSKIQTLHIYRVGTELTEMTTLTGTINGADGVGIRWEKDATGKLTFLTGLPLVNWRGCGMKMLDCVTTERRFERYQWQNGKFQLQP